MTDDTQTDEIHIDEFTPEILAFTFGEPTPQRDAIVIQLRVRQREGDRFVEGYRDPLLIHRVTLDSLAKMGPEVLAHMREIGADKDVLPPAHVALPAWDAGPSYNVWGTGGAATCNGLGYADFLPDEGAAVLLVTIKQRGAADQTGAYIMSHRAILALHKAAPKAMRKLDAKRQ